MQPAQVSCRCTVTDSLNETELVPGDSREFKVAFTTSASSSERHSVVLPVIEKGTGASQKIEFLLLASQQQSMSIEPLAIDFGKVHQDEKYTRTINFMEEPTDRFSIVGLDPNGTPIQGSFQTIGARNDLKTYQVEVVFSPNGQQPDREKDFFIVETSSVLRPKVNIPFNFHLLSDITVSPDTISLGSISLGETVSDFIEISSRKNEKINCKITKVPADCSVEILEQGNPVKIQAKLKPSQTGVWQEKIIVTVNTSSREEVLEINCVAYVR